MHASAKTVDNRRQIVEDILNRQISDELYIEDNKAMAEKIERDFEADIVAANIEETYPSRVAKIKARIFHEKTLKGCDRQKYDVATAMQSAIYWRCYLNSVLNDKTEYQEARSMGDCSDLAFQFRSYDAELASRRFVSLLREEAMFPQQHNK